MGADAAQGQQLERYIRICRILAIVLTLIAAVMMAINKYKYISYSSISGTGRRVYINISVKATDSSSFIYFVIANSIVFLYSLVTAVLSCVKRSKTGLVLPLVTLDLLATIVLFTGSAAAAAIEYVAWKGIWYYGWNKFCDIAVNFCGIATAANAISLLAASIYFVMVLLSVIAIQRRASS